MEFPTGGDEGFLSFLVRDPLTFVNGGSSESLGPTVKVWMGEELREFCGVLKFCLKTNI